MIPHYMTIPRLIPSKGVPDADVARMRHMLHVQGLPLRKVLAAFAHVDQRHVREILKGNRRKIISKDDLC